MKLFPTMNDIIAKRVKITIYNSLLYILNFKNIFESIVDIIVY